MNGESTSGFLIASILLGVAAFGIFFIEFVIPSGGLLAILCVICAIASVVVGFMLLGVMSAMFKITESIATR
jgi:hypothetical protein